MATVYSIMKAHAGHIECVSQVGRGTTFKLFFPAQEGTARPQQKKPRNVRIPSARGSETILMVDDEADLLSLGKEMLAKYDYTVLTAETGEEAIREYGRRGADLVLLGCQYARHGRSLNASENCWASTPRQKLSSPAAIPIIPMWKGRWPSVPVIF